MKHTKDGKNINALLRRAMLGVLDIMLFALANCSICYLTMNGHIMATDYKYMIFNYLHFGLTSVLLVGINSAFGLYRSVWYFAGSDEIVKSFLGALVNAVQLFLCDRFLFAKLLHTKGYLPYYAYILFFVLMFVATLIPRIGYRILRRYVHNLVGRRDGQKRIMIVGAGFNTMGSYVSSQDIVQRFTTTTDTKKLNKMMLTNGALSIFIATVFYLIGTGLYVFYQQNALPPAAAQEPPAHIRVPRTVREAQSTIPQSAPRSLHMRNSSLAIRMYTVGQA